MNKLQTVLFLILLFHLQTTLNSFARRLLHPTGPHHFIKNYTSQKRNYLLFHSNPKKLLMRHTHHSSQPRKIQSTNSSQLDALIQSAIASSGSNTTIVIINQTPTLTPNLDTLTNANQPGQTNCVTNLSSNSSTSQQATYMTLNDISGLVNITQSIGQLIDGYYKIFPDQNEILTSSPDSNILDNAANILSFYGKVRKFVVAIWDEKDGLQTDINTIRVNITHLKTSEMDMLRFLGLDKKYMQVKIQTAAYEAFDPKFGAYYMDMVDMTMNFTLNVQTALNTVVDLDNYSQMFYSAVQEIMTIGFNKYTSDFLNVLDKIDTVLMFLGTILELKVELTASVQRSITAFKVLGAERTSLDNTLVKLTNLADYYQLTDAKQNSLLTVKKADLSVTFGCFLITWCLVR